MKKFKKLFASMALSLTIALAAMTASASAYEVKPGDTMGKIALRHDMTLNSLSALNPQVKDINLIFVGENLKTDSTVASKPTAPENAKPVETVKPASSELDTFYRLVSAEAESEPYKGKVAVAKVVLNRVASDEFPNTITGVIYQKRQFSPVTNGAINKKADADSIKAVNEVVANYTGNPDGSLFFYDARTATSRWLDSRPTTEVIGNHTFKK